MITSYFPAEWEEQSAVQLTWPSKKTDWESNFDEAQNCYVEIATNILAYQLLIIVCENQSEIQELFSQHQLKKIRFYELKYNDTWSRDHGGITVFENGKAKLLDFKFNAWGSKFDAEQDNLLTKNLFENCAFGKAVQLVDLNDFVLEGGALESNGRGILLTTAKCIYNENRNPHLTKNEINDFLKAQLHIQKVICLEHGDVEGDDTDAHIDTLARFTDENTIVYLKSEDENYPHHQELELMEQELKMATNLKGQKFNLVPLTMSSIVKDSEGRILPATYVNFLIINGAVLAPVYGTPEDENAINVLNRCFPDKKVIPINCLPLIQQNGSLHCITMQFPKGVVN